MRDELLDRLPAALPPIHHEVLGSYLNRLAGANSLPFHRIVRLLSLAQRPPGFTPASDSTIGWTPAFPQRLAVLTGRPLEPLTKALPALARRPVPDLTRLALPISRACRFCVARRGAAGELVVVHAPARRHLCVRHRQWLRAPCDIPLHRFPEVVDSQRRLDRLARRHSAPDVDHVLKAVQAITQAWFHDRWHEPLLQRWNDRISRLRGLPAGPILLSEHRVSIAAFPEVVALTDVLLRFPGPTTNPRTAYLGMVTDLGSRLGFSYTTLGAHDPLYSYLARAGSHFDDRQVV